MDLFEAIIYGIIQGLTEFLPVSSSGHLAVMQNIFSTKDPDELMAFDVLLHLGTLVAVFIVYFRDIIPLFPAFFRVIGKAFKGNFKWKEYSQSERLVVLLVLATLPLVPAYFIEKRISFIKNYLLIVGVILIINGVMLFFSDKIGRRNRDLGTLDAKSSLLIGGFQAVAALFPGLSRSGSTITAGLLSGFDRQSAVKFSFILSLPAVAGACIMNIPDLFMAGESSEQILIYFVAAAVSAAVGVLAMKLLNYISVKTSFRGFSYYCVIIGIAAAAYAVVSGLI